MRSLLVTVVSSLLLAGCALRSASSAQPAQQPAQPARAAAGVLPPPPATPPTPKAPSEPEAVGAAEFRALRVARATALRQQPASRAERFGALNAGDVVLKLDGRGPWYRVWVPGVSLSGWIERGAVAAGATQPSGALSPVPVAELSMVTVARPGARLRSAASARGPVVRTLAKGEALRLVREEGSWLKVYDPEAKAAGYVASQLVRRRRR